MLRIYLDTNLLTKIDRDEHALFKQCLLNYSDYLNIVYSSAHITDLEKSSNSDLTLKDLTTIKFYSENQCLAKYWGEENIRYDIRDPVEFYESSRDSSINIKESIDNFNNECDKLGIENPLNKLNLNFKNSFDELDLIQSQDGAILFKRFKEHLTFQALFDDISEIFKQSLNSNDYLKKVREIWDKQLPRKIIGNVKAENVIGYLNEELPKTDFKKSFDELTLDSLKLRFKDESYSFFDWFVSRYNTLDIVGYKSDNKSSTLNIVADGFHAFYAAHCDILVSEDKRFRDKATVIYEETGVKTLIFSEKDFCSNIDDLITKIRDESTFTDIIKKIAGLEIESFYSIVSTQSTIREYFIGTFFGGYFNYAIWVSANNGSIIAAFTKEHKTYSKWIYYKELKALIKVFVDLLGPDIYNRNEFSDESQEFLQDDSWIGRKWVSESTLITLSKQLDLGFVFQIETLE